jgi:hydroxyethylthiazole kinase-like uncharacterized protein yjeF
MPAPVINIAQMREWENASWAAGRMVEDVIHNVGRCVAQTALRLTKPGDLIIVLSGHGNNGADAHATLEHFDERRVDTLLVKDPTDDFQELESLLTIRPALVIDGLFGIGLNRPLDDAWIKFIQRINAARLRVLAVDVPSGLNADTGLPEGAAVEASVTLTVGAPKKGLLLASAWPYVGRLEVAADVGLIACPFSGEYNWTLAGDFAGFPPLRSVAGHKGTFGHAAIFAGSMGYHGAAVLASRGAQRARPGLVTVFTQEEVYQPVASQLQAVMVHPWSPAVSLPGSFNALLIGPGLAAPQMAEEMRTITRRLWKSLAIPMVVDASALDWLPMEGGLVNAIRVITPHPGEAARLLNMSPQLVQSDRPHALRELSRRYGNCWVVLKGHQTIVGGSAGDFFVNSSGNPHLAQGGAGDVLAGFLTGMLAQPMLQAEAFKTIRHAVWLHGAAADWLEKTKQNWVVEDLTEALGTRP